MQKIELNENWKMRIAGEDRFFSATVPGSVYQDLLDQGRMEDPYFRDNEDRALEIMKQDFEYRNFFDVGKAQIAGADEVLLRFHGLDTIADITLNGTFLKQVDNMHRTWDFSVKHLLKEKENELVIYFHSPVLYIAEQFEKDPAILGTEDAMKGFPKIRKGHYMFGWDWGPRLPDAGIWKPVELLFVEKARLTRVYIRQNWKPDLSEVKLCVETKIAEAASFWKAVKAVRDADYAEERELDAVEESKTYGLKITVTDPQGEKLYDRVDAAMPLVIETPQFLWPNGFGSQPLYTVITELTSADGKQIYDRTEKRIGLRTMTMNTEKDAYGNAFAHVVNGVEIFAMGADYIPEDNILHRMNSVRTRDLLLQCKAANFNCIRVWGGGLYPDDSFFDICDELGLMVWQDFMFACANYRLTEDFEENIMAELKNQIRRLAHHASLGLWCGNNEMEMFVDQGEWGAKNEIKSDYVKIYEYLFPKLLKKEDPDRFYWPASPSTGGGFDFPNDPDRGDVHYWEVWHGNKPFSEYRKYFFRYASEFGFQSFPSVKTLETVTDDPRELNPFSYVMEKHQRNYGGNGKIAKYMQAAYRYPENFSDFVYASQLLQADGIRYGVEHYRRNRGRCMGAIYWQLNDCWPVISWSSIDYYGRWKALHYYAKRFFAPVMLSCEEQSWMTVEADMNRQHFEFEKSIRLNVTNETLDAHRVLVKWAVRKTDATILREEEQWLEVPALSAVWMDKVELPQIDCFNEYVSYEAWENDQIISQGTVIFSYPKYFRYLNPGLTVRVDGDEIVVKAEAYAKSVEIRNANDDLILEDNYFDMNAGEHRVKILDGKPDGLTVRSVYDI